MDRGVSLGSRGSRLGFGPAELMAQVNEWLKVPELLQHMAKLGGASEGERNGLQLETYARILVRDCLSEEMALDQKPDALRATYGPDVLAALTSQGMERAPGRTLVRLESLLSGREVTEIALDKAADPNQLALTRKEEQYLRLAQAGRFDLTNPQFNADPHFLPYQKIWSRLNPETQQAIQEGQQHWAEVAGYWGKVLQGERPTGPAPVDWWGVRGAALQQVEQKALSELTALRDELGSGKAEASGVGERLQRLDVYRDALGRERFDQLLQSLGAEGERIGEWLSFREQFVAGKKGYWHQVMQAGQETADRWDATHYQPLRERRDGALNAPVYGALVAAIQAEALSVHQAYAGLYQAKVGWWQAQRAGQPTDRYVTAGAEARAELKRLDPQAEGLWGSKAPPWPLDQQQRQLFEQERAAAEARRQEERGRQAGTGPAASAAELRTKFEQLNWTTMLPHADLIWAMSQKHGVQAEIIAAMIWQESRGRAEASAGPNAGKGLMQIEFGAHKSNLPGKTDAEKLKWVMEPANNLEYGTKLLKGILGVWIDKYGPDEGLKRGLQYYNYGSGAARWVEARSQSPDDWQSWVNKYHDTHKYDPKNDRWLQVESGGNYGNPNHWRTVHGHYTRLMAEELTVGLSPIEQRPRQYDGTKPAKGTTALEVWNPVEPPLTNTISQRSSNHYLDVVDQFAVAHNPRYSHRDTTGDGTADTFCNIFVWDVTRAMGAEIPHWVTAAGAPTSRSKGARELNANATLSWLSKHGETYGWREVTAQEAQEWANEGRPAVATWHSGSGAPGHIAMVIPGTFDAKTGPAIAQAGAKNLNRATVREGFGANRMKDVRYFIHD